MNLSRYYYAKPNFLHCTGFRLVYLLSEATDGVWVQRDPSMAEHVAILEIEGFSLNKPYFLSPSPLIFLFDACYFCETRTIRYQQSLVSHEEFLVSSWLCKIVGNSSHGHDMIRVLFLKNFKAVLSISTAKMKWKSMGFRTRIIRVKLNPCGVHSKFEP